MSRTISLSDDYRSPLRATLVIEFVVVILSGLMLDRGIFARIALIVVVGFWAGVFVMMIRRPQAPTAIDRALGLSAVAPVLAGDRSSHLVVFVGCVLTPNSERRGVSPPPTLRCSTQVLHSA